MRTLVLMLAAASAIAAAAPANAMTATTGTAPAIQAVIADQGMMQDAAYVCRHRYYSSGRFCYWRPTYRGWGWHRRRW